MTLTPDQVRAARKITDACQCATLVWKVRTSD
jgi:hypothetical protein